MTKVTLICNICGAKARRSLMLEPGSRGVHETSSEPSLCPKGHGLMAREDGVSQERWALWGHRYTARRINQVPQRPPNPGERNSDFDGCNPDEVDFGIGGSISGESPDND